MRARICVRDFFVYSIINLTSDVLLFIFIARNYYRRGMGYSFLFCRKASSATLATFFFEVYMAHDYVIISDTTCNLPKEFYEDDFAIIPMDVIIDGKAYDADSMSRKDFYNEMRHGILPTTSLINTATAVDFFTPYLEKGQDVFFICFSSKLSGSFKSVSEAREELLEKYPDRKICVLDSKSASGGEGMLVYYCLKKRREGATFSELKEFAEAFRDVCHHDFTVNDLMHLYRGGRLKKSAAIVGTAMQVKPILITDTDGYLVPIAKVIGRKMAIKALFDKMCEKSEGIDNSEFVYIEHADCEADALVLKQKIEEHFGYKNIYINELNPIIGTHVGPECLALFYIGKDKQK